MNAALTLLQILVMYGPSVYAAAIELLHHPEPTKDDFIKLGQLVSQESYDEFIRARREARGLPPVVIAPGPTNQGEPPDQTNHGPAGSEPPPAKP